MCLARVDILGGHADAAALLGAPASGGHQSAAGDFQIEQLVKLLPVCSSRVSLPDTPTSAAPNST